MLQYLKMKDIHAVGAIRVIISNCLMLPNKNLEKTVRAALDYRSDSNSVLIVAILIDNNIVQLCSNYAGVKSMSAI